MTEAVSSRTGDRTWVRLDNASNIFLAARNEVDTKVFRLAADLDEPVDPELLQQALDHVYAQYPLFRAVLRHGIFWYYLQQSSLHPQVGEDVLPSVTHIYRSDSRELLFRVLHRGNRISLEIFHALTDGTGALWFFEDLLTAYVGLRHPETFTGPSPGVGTVKQEFTVDAFTHWFRSRRGRASFADEAATPVDSAPVPTPPTAGTGGPPRRKTPGRRVVSVHGSPTPDLRSRVVELSMPVAPVLELARAEGVSITIFLAALFLQSVRQVRQPANHEDTMTVSVPVNLRQFFPTTSGRNFFATTRLEHSYGGDGDEIGAVCRDLAEQFGHQLTKEGLTGKMRRLIAFERHPVLRFFPRPVKDRVLAVVNWLNNRGITVAMSNLGRVSLPEPTAEHVRGLYFHVSAARPQLCAITCGDELTVSVTSPFVETDYHAAFVRHLSSHHIPVSVDSSRVTSEEILAVTEAAT